MTSITDSDRLAVWTYKPKPRPKELIFLVALTTVPCRKDGWRRVRDLRLAGWVTQYIDVAELARVRARLIAAGLIDYRPGPGRGSGSYRIRVPGVRGASQ
jgi:hypothetical protein